MARVSGDSCHDYSNLNSGNMAVVVVLYNPDKAQIDNLDAFIKFKKIIIVDNSSASKLSLVSKKIPKNKLIYQHHPSNIGLSKAYNLALLFSEENGIDYLMIADQDSKFSAKTIDEVANRASKLRLNLSNTAAIGISWYTNLKLVPNGNKIDKNVVLLSSGSIISVKIARNLDGFDERFFIDSVDTQFCLKAINEGYETIKLLSLGFIHNIGDPKIIKSKLFKKELTLYNHSPIRRYYQIRNSMLIKKLFGHSHDARTKQFVDDTYRFWVKDQLKTIIYEGQKFKKLYYSLLGFLHFNFNRFGKL